MNQLSDYFDETSSSNEEVRNEFGNNISGIGRANIAMWTKNVDN